MGKEKVGEKMIDLLKELSVRCRIPKSDPYDIRIYFDSGGDLSLEDLIYSGDRSVSSEVVIEIEEKHIERIKTNIYSLEDNIIEYEKSNEEGDWDKEISTYKVRIKELEDKLKDSEDNIKKRRGNEENYIYTPIW